LVELQSAGSCGVTGAADGARCTAAGTSAPLGEGEQPARGCVTSLPAARGRPHCGRPSCCPSHLSPVQLLVHYVSEPASTSTNLQLLPPCFPKVVSAPAASWQSPDSRKRASSPGTGMCRAG